MIKHALLAGVVTALVAGPALAAHCPQDAAAIDHALGVLDVSEDVRAEVTELRDRGMELHDAGDHRESERVLAEAMRMLLTSVE